MKYLALLALLFFPGAALAQYQSAGPGPSFASPVLVVSTSAPVTLTGLVNATETNASVLRIPANSMGKNGSIMLTCTWTYTNSANTKTMTYRFGAISGSITANVLSSSATATTTQIMQTINFLRNINATNVQQSYPANPTLPFGTSAGAPTAGTADTTTDNFIDLNATLALGSETITMQNCTALVMKAP